MRTTVEITDEQRGQLMRLAAQRGLKGFSQLVQEAIDLFLATKSNDAERRRAALQLEGTFRDPEGEALVERTRAVRKSWR
jgi:hypothetical protein